MKATLKQINGVWDIGWVLDKHSIQSTYVGVDQNGHDRFETVRTEAGEATYQLKYKNDWTKVPVLANAIVQHIYPKLDFVGFIVPMPPTAKRFRQPVVEVAEELGRLVSVPVFTNLLLKTTNGKSIKDLHTKEEKIATIGNSITINDQISEHGKWNVLLIDDLYHTGASMEVACKALRGYEKVNRIYVAALTWR